MKTTELMRGDIVLFEDKLYYIIFVWEKKVGLQPVGDPSIYARKKVYAGKLQPVPITEAFLQLNHFEPYFDKAANMRFWFSEDHRVELRFGLTNQIGKYWGLHIDSPDMDTILKADINHVHEMQHMYKQAELDSNFVIH